MILLQLALSDAQCVLGGRQDALLAQLRFSVARSRAPFDEPRVMSAKQGVLLEQQHLLSLRRHALSAEEGPLFCRQPPVAETQRRWTRPARKLDAKQTLWAALRPGYHRAQR